MKRYVSLNNIKINFIAVIIPSLLFVRIFRDYLISLNIVKFIFILVVLIILFLLMCEILIRLDKKFKYSSILCLILQIMVIAVFTIKPISIPLNIKSVLKDNSYIISDFILEPNKEYNVDVSIEGNLEDLSIQLFRFYVDGIQPMEELVSEVDIVDFDKFIFIARENTEYYFIRLVGLNKNTNIKVSNLRINGDEYLLNSFFIPYQYIHQLDLMKYDKESVSHRFLYYKDSIKILKDNGILIGHGFNSFSYYTDIYEFNYLEKDPHSYLFSLLLDIGIYGLVYVVCLIIFGLLGMWKNRKRKSKAIWFCIFSLCVIVLPFDCIYSVMYMKVLLMLSFVMVSTVSVKDLRK